MADKNFISNRKLKRRLYLIKCSNKRPLTNNEEKELKELNKLYNKILFE